MSAHYTKTNSGFRYRLLTAQPQDGYEAAKAELLDDELLYRMMDGEHRVMGKLFPVLMDEEINYAQSIDMLNSGQWKFVLAAGIPVTDGEKV